MKIAKKMMLAASAGAVMFLGACGSQVSDAHVASENLSVAADQFEIDRRIVFVNGITDEHLLVIEGRCSINDQGHQLEVTCKTGANEYKKHFLGRSANVTYFAEHLEPTRASDAHYRVILKPSTLLPDLDIE